MILPPRHCRYGFTRSQLAFLGLLKVSDQLAIKAQGQLLGLQISSVELK